MKRAACGTIILALCLTTLTGCVLNQRDRTNPANPSLLEPQSVLKFTDVPIPVGFKQIPLESFCFETSSMRTGLLKYQGKGNPDLIVNFYKEQMAMYNWSLLNVVEYGQRLMNFDRENETCIINIVPKGSSSAITITIAIGPKNQQYSKKEKPIK